MFLYPRCTWPRKQVVVRVANKACDVTPATIYVDKYEARLLVGADGKRKISKKLFPCKK